MTEKTPKINTRDLSHIIRRPRITEKASDLVARNAYAFEVSADATKDTIVKAVKEKYNVTPIRVAVMPIPSKKVFVRGKMGVKRGGKKAYVYLKEGDKIEFV